MTQMTDAGKSSRDVHRYLVALLAAVIPLLLSVPLPVRGATELIAPGKYTCTGQVVVFCAGTVIRRSVSRSEEFSSRFEVSQQ